METGEAVARRTTRLRATLAFFRRALLVSVALNLVLLVVVIRGCVSPDTARAILVDGQLVCLVRSERAADQVHEALLAAISDEFPGQATFRQKWEDKEWPAQGEKILSNEEAVELLSDELDVVVEAFAIQIGGRNLVVLPTQEAADEALNTVKANFVADGETLLEPQEFEEQPDVVPVPVPPAEIVTDIHSAADDLLRGTTAPTPYTVKAGDTPHKVATAYDMTVEQLYAANEGLEERAAQNDIHPGDTWMISITQPSLTVITKKEISRTEPIPFETISEARPSMPKGEVQVTRAGVPGEQRVWIQGVWRNDKLNPSTKKTVRQETLKEPEPKRVVAGTGPPA